MSGGFNWAKFLQDQGRAQAQLEQLRKDQARMEAKLDKLATVQEDTKVLVGSVRGGYKVIAVTAAVIGALATLVARWWVITHTGAP